MSRDLPVLGTVPYQPDLSDIVPQNQIDVGILVANCKK
jgi:hypothetical protein